MKLNPTSLLWFFAILVLTKTELLAQAPDSLAGKVFHDHFGLSAARTTGASIVRLNADGTCTFIRTSSGSVLNSQAVGVVFLSTPPADSTWSYVRTSPNTGVLSIAPTSARTLTFASSTSGMFSGTPGVGSFTLTDPATAATAPLSNVSLRARVEPGRPIIAGFVVPGTERRDILVRVVGPSLSQFGLSGTWADPDFTVVPGQANTSPGVSIPDAYYADWSGPQPTSSPVLADSFRKIFSYVGAFPLLDGSKDAAQIINVGPGAYTVVCIAPAGDPGGEALIEIYYLP